MKKILSLGSVLALVFAVAFTFTACPSDGGGNNPPPDDTTPPTVTNVTLSSDGVGVSMTAATVSGNVIITFSEIMDNNTQGRVTL